VSLVCKGRLDHKVKGASLVCKGRLDHKGKKGRPAFRGHPAYKEKRVNPAYRGHLDHKEKMASLVRKGHRQQSVNLRTRRACMYSSAASQNWRNEWQTRKGRNLEYSKRRQARRNALLTFMTQ